MSHTQPTAGVLPLTLRDRVAVWRELLDQCGRKPLRKRVHALRVVTLRIQAELEHELAELPSASHQAQAMLRFGKLADKLRQVLGPVRELDVWIGKLQKLRTSLGNTTEYVPRSTRECIRQMERLEDRLRKKRRSAAEKLIAQIAKRRGDLVQVSDEVDQLARDRLHTADTDIVETILKQFADVASRFSAFDEENLHDFRKQIKKVRYLAEIHQDADPICGRIATQVKKVQSAIGEWHDWQVLARTAKHGRYARQVELGELLDSLAGETLEAAIATCHSIKARILDLHAGPPSNGVEGKPPLRSGLLPSTSLRRLA